MTKAAGESLERGGGGELALSCHNQKSSEEFLSLSELQGHLPHADTQTQAFVFTNTSTALTFITPGLNTLMTQIPSTQMLEEKRLTIPHKTDTHGYVLPIWHGSTRCGSY